MAAEDSRAIEFDARGVRALIGEDPGLAERLEAARGRLIELYAYPETHSVPTGAPPKDQ